MFWNYFKNAVRQIYLNKIFFGINIVGLAIGLSASYLMMVYVFHELSIDKLNVNYDRIYRIDSYWNANDYKVPMTAFPLASAAESNIPEIESVARITRFSNIEIKCQNEIFRFENNYFSDTSILNVFTFPLLSGQTSNQLNDPYSAVINEEVSLKLFGSSNGIGKVFTVLLDENEYDIVVRGIFEKGFNPSTIKPDVLFSLDLLAMAYPSYNDDEWVRINSVMTYLILSHNCDLNELEKKLKSIHDDHIKDIPNYVMDVTFKVVPLKETYYTFEAGYTYPDYLPRISKEDILIYSSVAILLLILGVINFISINLAKASTRNKEIGVRKILGARRKQIFLQTLVESLVSAVITFPITLFFIDLILPYFNEITNSEIAASYFMNAEFIFLFFFLNLIIGVIAGSYLSIYLTKLNPVRVFRNNVNTGKSNSAVRRILLVFQMSVFIALIISVVTLNEQMTFAHDLNKGIDVKNQIIIYLRQLEEKKEAFKALLQSYSGVLNASFTLNYFPYNRGNIFSFAPLNDKDRKSLFSVPMVGYEYMEMIDLELIKGQFPDKDNSQRKVIINETAEKALGIDYPVGEIIIMEGLATCQVVAVVKDFHLNSFRDPIKPMAMRIVDSGSNLIVKTYPGRSSEVIEFIQKKWSEFSDKPLICSSIDERIDQLYNDEIRFTKMISLFTFFAVIIAVLGLFGSILFASQRRTKEIGIRKVLGASVMSIFTLVTKEIFALMIVSFLIAYPLAYFFMNNWLERFAYRIDIGLGILLTAGLITAIIILVTTVYHSIKAAITNPVNSIKYE